MKNVFIIPSWYPSQNNPIAGASRKEHSLAISKYRSEYRIIISLRSDVDTRLNINKPFDVIKQFLKGYKERVLVNKLSYNCLEIKSPAFTCRNMKYPFTAFDRFYFLNLENLKYAKKKYGEIKIIHAHNCSPAGFVAAKLSKKFNIPYVITEHTSGFEYDAVDVNGKLRTEFKYALNGASKCIAVSKSLALIFKNLGLPSPLIIPNMTDENRFKYIEKDNEQIFSYLTVCGITHKKGIGDLLEAIRLWSPPKGEVLFKIIGDGPQFEEYKCRSIEIGIDHLIQWIGSVSREKIPVYFNNCSAFVLPSHTETFGIVYIEALASGKPIIATKCGGPEDIVNDTNGLIIEKQNVKELAYALQWMYNNYNQYDPVNIRNYFEENYSYQAVTKMIADLYEEVINIK